MFRVARRYRFSASHRLHSPLLSDRDNAEIYGKCNNPYGHGHDYILEVKVRGESDPRTGLVVPIRRLDEYVRREVLDAFDHKYLNEDIAAFRETPPTTERVAEEIERRLASGWKQTFSASLDGVRILETRRNSVELESQRNF
jgi:6-pyruvoyltetrahydropterin/6-carboxytetrahydropterin synthase